MPISPADEQVLAQSYRNLQEGPIQPGHPFYVEIWEHSDHDPVRRLFSLQLFSGFSGSGKSTQLRRLQQDLTAQGYLVVYANAEDYLNLGEPIEVEELLVTIACAFSDNVDTSLLTDSDDIEKRLANREAPNVRNSASTIALSGCSEPPELFASQPPQPLLDYFFRVRVP